MSVSTARVPTYSAGRYLQQLASHWRHKLDVTTTDDAATIVFPNATTLDLRAGDDMLDVRLAVPEGEDAVRMREVVVRHLDRFAFREAPLTFDWHDG